VNDAEWTDTLVRILSDEAARTALGDAQRAVGRADVRERFWADYARIYERLTRR
jgi:glycosyltransferase involved in cell wall biosynthesis